jgi:hypothetical protein
VPANRDTRLMVFDEVDPTGACDIPTE